MQVVGVHLDRGVAAQHHDVGVVAHDGLVARQVGPQLRGLFVDVGEDAVETAVAVDQLGRRLLPYPGHPGQIVGWVASQGGVLGVQDRGDTGAFEDAGFVVEGVVRHAPAVVEHLDEGVFDELVGVTVPGDDDDVVAAVAAAGGQGGDEIVGFETDQLQHRQMQRFDHLTDQAHLLAQDVGGFGSARFIGGDGLVAKGRLWPIETHRHLVGTVVTQQVDEHRGEAVHGVGDLAGGSGHVGREGEKGPVRERVPIDQQQRRHGGGDTTGAQPGPRGPGPSEQPNAVARVSPAPDEVPRR